MKQIVKPLRIDHQRRRLIVALRAEPGDRRTIFFRNDTGERGKEVTSDAGRCVSLLNSAGRFRNSLPTLGV